MESFNVNGHWEFRIKLRVQVQSSALIGRSLHRYAQWQAALVLAVIAVCTARRPSCCSSWRSLVLSRRASAPARRPRRSAPRTPPRHLGNGTRWQRHNQVHTNAPLLTFSNTEFSTLGR